MTKVMYLVLCITAPFVQVPEKVIVSCDIFLLFLWPFGVSLAKAWHGVTYCQDTRAFPGLRC